MKCHMLTEVVCWGDEDADGSCSCSECDCGIYSTLRRAKQTMLDLARKRSSGWLGFWIFERGVDEGRVGPFDGFCQYDSVRAYAADGSLLCHSPYDEACRREFRGRDPASVPIKAGEVAWRVGGGTASPVLVGSGPVTKEAWRAMAKRAEERRRRLRLDFSDDCYYVYEYDNGHAHPPVWSVFPYAGKMSKRNMDRLLKTKKWYDEGCPGA